MKQLVGPTKIYEGLTS